MSLAARIYIAFVFALGAIAFGVSLSQWSPHELFRLLCYFVLAIPAAGLKVRLPGVTGTMSVLFVLLLAAIADFGLPEAVLIGVSCVLVQCFWHAKVRPRLVQPLFTMANVAFAVWLTNAAYSYVSHVAPSLLLSVRLSLASTVFFAANTFPVSVVIALTENKPLRQVWNRGYVWTLSYYVAGATIIGVFSPFSRGFNWQLLLVILPLVYVMHRSYRLYMGQLEAERTRVSETQKHAEQVAALHGRTVEALNFATTAIQASPLAVMTLDRNRIVTSWNRMAERILGWSPEETIGSPLPFSGGMSEEVIGNLVNDTLHGRAIAGFEIRHFRRDGTPFEATIWTAPLHDASGSISGVLITIADVSDRKHLEEQLRLAQKLEAVGRLAGGVAHDFNNMLTVINGYSAMLIENLKREGIGYAVGQAEEIYSAGTRAGELVAQLLAFSRRQMIKPKPIQVVELVGNVEKMLRRVLGEDVEVRTKLDPDSGWIRADSNQMEAVLLNLATNARDAMPDGGILDIESAPVAITQEQARKNPELPHGSYCKLSVRDTGHGMDAETQQHIFEPFFTTKELGKGTGLGLSTVYGTIEQSGGHIFVTSSPGNGTTFSIYLPRFDAASSCGPAVEVSDLVRKGNETILLVEDEGSVRQMLREALSEAGYRVWEAANGADALAKWGARINEVDLVISDIVMPVMNGLKLAEEIRSLRPRMKVLFMSGHSEDLINRQSGPDLGTDLLQKPFVPQVLVRKVRETLDQTVNSARRQVPGHGFRNEIETG